MANRAQFCVQVLPRNPEGGSAGIGLQCSGRGSEAVAPISPLVDKSFFKLWELDLPLPIQITAAQSVNANVGFICPIPSNQQGNSINSRDKHFLGNGIAKIFRVVNTFGQNYGRVFYFFVRHLAEEVMNTV